MDMQNYINRYNLMRQTPSVNINTSLFLFNLFHSIKMKNFNYLMGIKFEKAHTARLACIILIHFNNYHRNIQSDLCRLYSVRPQTAANILNKLTEHGLLLSTNCKRKTNIGVYVSLKAYQITKEGRKVVIEIEKAINATLLNYFKVA